jgi:hypothetical protein
MKRLHYTMAILIALIIAGFGIASYGQNRSRIIADNHYNVLMVVPTALTAFPDIEHVPVYQNPSIMFTLNEPDKARYISYEVTDPIDHVKEFYHETLPRRGWLLRSRDGQQSKYSWTNPAEKPLWHMYLKVTVQLASDDSKTLVFLEYGRYPNLEMGLPTYPDARQATTTSANVDRSFPDIPGLPDIKEHVRRTDLSYLSVSGPREIADFYINSMRDSGWSLRKPGWSKDEYAWFYYDQQHPQEAGSDTDETISQEGLYFFASRPSWDKPNNVFFHLLITAKGRDDGQTVVKIRVEEFEPTNPIISNRYKTTIRQRVYNRFFEELSWSHGATSRGI